MDYLLVIAAKLHSASKRSDSVDMVRTAMDIAETGGIQVVCGPMAIALDHVALNTVAQKKRNKTMSSDMRMNIKTTSKAERLALYQVIGSLGEFGEIYSDGTFDFQPSDNEDHDEAMERLEARGIEFENI